MMAFSAVASQCEWANFEIASTIAPETAETL
jgi:hypothetical protein